MPLRLDIEKKLHARSERVKCVDVHPSEPWALVSLYTGQVVIYDYNADAVVKQFEVSDQPVRSGKFVSRKQWIVVVADDMFLRVYNYNTMEKVHELEAHQDYIRSVAVHPARPLVLTASDDMLVKLWDWERGWACTMVYEGHSHYVMQVAFNPKDPNTFASASLDRSIRIWSLASPVPNLALEGHEKGVNCVDYYPGGDRPYLVSGGDDHAVVIWDVQTKTPVQQLLGHSANVSAVTFHPSRPLILSGSEDGTVRLWNSNTYRLESTLNYGMDRCWSVACLKSSNVVALGFDLGTVVIRIGRDDPIVSMDASGKVVMAKQNEIVTSMVRQASAACGGEALSDGERLPLSTKDLGSCEIYPQQMSHSPNGRFVAVSGDGEYTIYTALAWRNKSFGQGDELVWDNSQGEYAVREGTARVRVFSKTHKERTAMRPPFAARAIFGGTLLAVAAHECVCFYDWESLHIVQRIDVAAHNVVWSDSADMAAIVCADHCYLLRYNREAVERAVEARGGRIGDDGVDESFTVLHEFADKVVTCKWAGECFLYTTGSGRLNYVVGGEVALLAHMDRPQYLLGYLPSENRVYLVDRDYQIVSYALLLAVLQFKTAIARGQQDAAFALLPSIPKPEHNRLARFLESQGLKEAALGVATDPDYRFELSVALGRLAEAAELARAHPSELKWRQLADVATANNDFSLAEQSMVQAHDLSGLLVLYSSRGDADGLAYVAEHAAAEGQMNVAFLCNYLLHRTDACLDVLLAAERMPEAALFARTYAPARVPAAADAWRKWLREQGDVRAADMVADPKNQPELFVGYEASLRRAEEASAAADAPVDRLAELVGAVGMTNGAGDANAERATADGGILPASTASLVDVGHDVAEAEAESAAAGNADIGCVSPSYPETDPFGRSEDSGVGGEETRAAPSTARPPAAQNVAAAAAAVADGEDDTSNAAARDDDHDEEREEEEEEEEQHDDDAWGALEQQLPPPPPTTTAEALARRDPAAQAAMPATRLGARSAPDASDARAERGDEKDDEDEDDAWT